MISKDFTHFLKEQDSTLFCPYCGTKKENEFSDFADSFHYISFTCTNCNKENRYKVNFMSSGVNKKIITKPLKENLEKIIIKDLGL